MKNGKRPTRKQKEAIKHSGLSPDKWLVSKADQDHLLLVHRETGTTKLIYS
ncbi:DUF6906 family protein [Halalkalibacter krulwichiae]|uniref:DUF6906 domain-containing protein n=1 Tax=Halalkalibacter krulwichiae TaxID=199441 RepID=A0A1X9MFE4_9BACI|nr:hypothetical protein [Halalkalibacter krulwichiae]ARK32169.1 hypothetical protein BkAM31D_21250 [Halalkalibacter krulwichiae]